VNPTTLKEPAASTSPRLGYSSLDEEAGLEALPLRGELPDWLAGNLVRVTPALLDPAGSPVRHWFDGLAMLHAFDIRGGSVSYASRFLESEDYRHAREHGGSRGQGFANDPCRSLFQRAAALFSTPATDNCNVSVGRLGERWIAMTESPIPIEFDPETLETLGPVKWADRTAAHTGTAHPHHDPRRGELVSYVMRFGPVNTYKVFALPDGSRKRRLIAKLPVGQPAYMHSFGLTDRYVILIDQPLLVNTLRLALSSKPFIDNYKWKPDRGTRFLVVDRETGALSASVKAEPFFTFHQVNAFEDEGELVVDLVGYDDPSVIEQLQLDRLRRDEAPQSRGTLRRYRLPLDGGAARREDLFDEAVELPRIAYGSRNGRPYRYVYAAGLRPGAPAPAFNQLVKIDTHQGSSRRWHEHGCYPGEPVFVPAPGSQVEDEGVVLSVVLDAAAKRSFLLVLDAAGFHELARAEAPHHIPFGFHGDFKREEA
jgi:beta,beta-carotene 9',10'-dioxygenase